MKSKKQNLFQLSERRSERNLELMKRMTYVISAERKNGKTAALQITLPGHALITYWLEDLEERDPQAEVKLKARLQGLDSVGKVALSTFDYFLEKWDGKIPKCPCGKCDDPKSPA